MVDLPQFINTYKTDIIKRVLKQYHANDHQEYDIQAIEDITDRVLDKVLLLNNGKTATEIGQELFKSLKNYIHNDSDFLLFAQIFYSIRRAFNNHFQKQQASPQVLQNMNILVINDFIDLLLMLFIEKWNKDQIQLQKKNHKLINKLTIVKNDLQNHLDVVYQLIKDAPLGMAACDEDYIVEFWNPMATRLTGFFQSDILKKKIFQVFTFESQTEFIFKMTSKEKSIVRMKLNMKMKEGGIFPVWISVSKIKDIPFGKIKYVISFYDLKKDEMIRSQMEKIDQLSAIARLSGAIMHDIRNPINTIGLNLDVLEQSLETAQTMQPPVADILLKIHRQIEQLTQNLNQYLGYSKLSELNLERIDLLENLTTMITDRQFHYSGKNIHLQLTKPRGTIHIICDWVQLRRALINLIQNAVDAIGEQGIVRVDVQKKKRRLTISVSDNGPGMETDSIKHIYEPYFSTKASGIGLGLFITREIVRGHRGRIYCTSRMNRGTRFTISLPRID